MNHLQLILEMPQYGKAELVNATPCTLKWSDGKCSVKLVQRNIVWSRYSSAPPSEVYLVIDYIGECRNHKSGHMYFERALPFLHARMRRVFGEARQT